MPTGELCLSLYRSKGARSYNATLLTLFQLCGKTFKAGMSAQKFL